jgi:hypothetical protein
MTCLADSYAADGGSVRKLEHESLSFQQPNGAFISAVPISAKQRDDNVAIQIKDTSYKTL